MKIDNAVRKPYLRIVTGLLASFRFTTSTDRVRGALALVLMAAFLLLASSPVSAQEFAWATGMGGTGGPDRGRGIAVDASGNVYTTGYFEGTVDFDLGAGTANLTSAGDRDVFVSKLDASGNFVWAKGMGGALVDEGRGIAVDASGNVYTTGYFEGTADFDPGAGTANLTNADGADIFVQKLLQESGLDIWVQFGVGGAHTGTLASPVATLSAAMGLVTDQGTVWIKSPPSDSSERITLGQNGQRLFLKAYNGTVRIGVNGN